MVCIRPGCILTDGYPGRIQTMQDLYFSKSNKEFSILDTKKTKKIETRNIYNYLECGLPTNI